MLKNILNLEGVKQLSKIQMKSVTGGACHLYVRYATGGGYWSAAVSLEQAQSQWDGTLYNDGSHASGYCCASCPKGLS